MKPEIDQALKIRAPYQILKGERVHVGGSFFSPATIIQNMNEKQYLHDHNCDDIIARYKQFTDFFT